MLEKVKTDNVQDVDKFNLPKRQLELDLTDFGSVGNVNDALYWSGIENEQRVKTYNDNNGMLFECENSVYILTSRDPFTDDKNGFGYAGYITIFSESEYSALKAQVNIVNNADIKGTGNEPAQGITEII